jgi:hypothetical protein
MTEPTLDRWTTLFLFAAVQGVFLALLLFLHQKGNRNANRILATIVLLFSVMLLYYVSFWSGYATKYRWLNGWTEPLVFLFGPLTWLYLRCWKMKTGEKDIHSISYQQFFNFCSMFP